MANQRATRSTRAASRVFGPNSGLIDHVQGRLLNRDSSTLEKVVASFANIHKSTSDVRERFLLTQNLCQGVSIQEMVANSLDQVGENAEMDDDMWQTFCHDYLKEIGSTSVGKGDYAKVLRNIVLEPDALGDSEGVDDLGARFRQGIEHYKFLKELTGIEPRAITEADKIEYFCKLLPEDWMRQINLAEGGKADFTLKDAIRVAKICDHHGADSGGKALDAASARRLGRRPNRNAKRRRQRRARSASPSSSESDDGVSEATVSRRQRRQRQAAAAAAKALSEMQGGAARNQGDDSAPKQEVPNLKPILEALNQSAQSLAAAVIGNHQNGATKPPLTCYGCGQQGHVRATCPNAPPCWTCNKPGHRAANCPDKAVHQGPPGPPAGPPPSLHTRFAPNPNQGNGRFPNGGTAPAGMGQDKRDPRSKYGPPKRECPRCPTGTYHYLFECPNYEGCSHCKAKTHFSNKCYGHLNGKLRE